MTDLVNAHEKWLLQATSRDLGSAEKPCPGLDWNVSPEFRGDPSADRRGSELDLTLFGSCIPCRQVAEEMHRLLEEIRKESAHLEAVRKEERAIISREIHDELGQVLAVLKMDVVWLARKLSDEDQHLSGKVRTMAAQIDRTIRTVQRISAELRPSILDELGLKAAVEWQVREFGKNSGIRSELDWPANLGVFGEIQATAIFRIVQEALTNVLRHSGATQVRVRLREQAGELVLSVSDNGRGITPREISHPRSLGLVGIRERVRGLGGRVSIRGIPDHGTVIRVKFPLTDGKANP